jgi:arylformamidase
MAERWLDISVPIYSGMVHWPDNPPIQIERVQDIGSGDAANVSKISFGVHTGTHMDAPIHFLPDGQGIDIMPLSATIGPARVIEIGDPTSIKVEELRPHDIRQGERILLRTSNSVRCWQTDSFVEDFVYLTQGAARYLAQQRIRAVGVDYLSVGGFRNDGVENHQALLEAGIWIIEGLNLSQVQPGTYDLICLPLRIVGSDGAPARAALRISDDM